MNELMSTLSSKVETNNLTELKAYIEETDNAIKENSNAIDYSYNLNINLYKNSSDEVVQVNPSTVMDSLGLSTLTSATSTSSSVSSLVSSYDVWTEMIDNQELLETQYDLLAGKWPENFNEVVLIVGENNEISDYTLYALGLKDQDELEEQMEKILNGETVEETETTSYTYEEILELSYKLILNSDYYEEENGVWVDKSDDEEYMQEKINDAEEITVVGIIRQNDQTVATSMSGGIGYTSALEEYVIEKSNEAEIVKEQKENPDVNVFTGLEFPDEDDDSGFSYDSLSDEQKLAMSQLSSEELAELMEVYTENQDASYEDNLETLGAVDLDSPSAINIYPKDFDAKDAIADAIDEYNDMQKENGNDENTITYTDLVGTMMKSVNQIINIISYVLIAFVAISLIVSSIMIGIITYISVLERTKEIGILRAIGASKRDISSIFNAETLIIGLISGLLGIGITILLTFPINSIIYNLTGVIITANVPVVAGIVLVALSVLLTTISGLIPSRIASKKDPVVALRTE